MSIRDRISGNDLTTIGSGSASGGKSLRTIPSNRTIQKPDERVANALSRATAAAGGHHGNIGFVIDATASRSGFWEQSVGITRRMFEKMANVGKMHLRLIHYGGSTPPVDGGWVSTLPEVTRQLNAVTCSAGGTQILPSLDRYISDDPSNRAKSILLVGDCFEESPAMADAAAQMLKNRNIKIYACQEGGDPTAEAVFKKLASITGGKYFRLGDDIPLDEIFINVALLTIGGSTALKRLGSGRSATLLLGQDKGPDNKPPAP